ncbi:metallophosphoesterase [Candidatus Fermentibacterales bacterium]|nr:metallophosphoesterase [Candidatus Fermentibacterales bacterium]
MTAKRLIGAALVAPLSVSCLLVLASGAADGSLEPPFHKDPYLLYTGTISEMTVHWQLDSQQQCLIEWGTDTTYSMGSALTDEYTTDHLHIHTITGLTPSVHYYYQVSCSGSEIEGNFWAAPSTSATNASFMVYGDTRTNYMTHDSLVAVMVAQYEVDPGFQTLFLHSGDLVYTGGLESSWQNEFFSDEQLNLRQLMREVPMVACLGNHELYSDTAMHIDTPLFGKYLPYPYVDRRYWSFDYGPAHFVIADHYPEYYEPFEPGEISAEQLAWIESDLAATSKPWKFVIIHEPGWSCGPVIDGDPAATSPPWISGIVREPGRSCGRHANNEDVQNLLQPLLEAYGVQMLFTGHNHYYSRASVNGVQHVSTGGGGAPLAWPQPGWPNIVTGQRSYHFCRVEISGNLLCLCVVDMAGEVIDSVCVNLNIPVNYLLGSVTIGSGPGNVQDVLIEADGESCSPDRIGYYGMMLEPGTYTVTATLSGYTPQTFEGVEVFEETETTLDIEMNPLSVEEEGVAGPVSLTSSPNPFSSSTTIDFELPEAGHVRLDVFDISGRLIETLVDGEMTAGQHSVEINGCELEAGVYLLVMRTPGSTASVKCLVAR